MDTLREMTPEQRATLAGEMIDSAGWDDRFRDLLLVDRDAFRPHADRVLAWDDARICQLRDKDFRNYWKIARGASDAVVDALAETIRANLPALEVRRADPNRYRTGLLAGAGTPRAYTLLGDLARQSVEVAWECREHHLEVPARGPVVRRFVPESLDINAYRVNQGEVVHSPGLTFPAPAGDFLPENRGWICLSPVAHVLTARLDLLPGDPLAASPLKVQHWFLQSGEECCDEATVGFSLAYRALRDTSERVELLAHLPGAQPLYSKWTWNTDRMADGTCAHEAEEEPEPAKNRHRLVLEPFCEQLDYPNQYVGRLGGTADWLQQPEVPDCPGCGRLMFYVGQVETSSVRGDVINASLFAFHCEDCGIGAQVVQTS